MGPIGTRHRHKEGRKQEAHLRLPNLGAAYVLIDSQSIQLEETWAEI